MKLRILTYNIFFEPVAMELRMQAIGRIIERMRPAIVGFQEVTRDSLSLLKKQRWTRYYDCSVDVAPPFSEAYFVVLFSALPVLALETLPFHNSGMGRELVTMRVEVAPGKNLLVGTSHLESMPQCARTRVAQLKDSLRFLDARVDDSTLQSSSSSTSSPPHANRSTTCLGAVFMGDTNLLHSDMKLMDSRLGRTVADLDVEHAKSGRSKCRMCEGAIEKDSIRVGRKLSEQLPSGRHLTLTMWYHEQCFLNCATVDEAQVVQSYSRQRVAAECSIDDSTTPAPAGPDLATLGLPPGWKDLWLTIDGNTDENGYTFDGKVNALVSSRAFRSRLDRMYFYAGASVRDAFTASSAAVLEAIHIVGRKPISDKLWPSDHFGLLASFDFDTTRLSTGAASGTSVHTAATTPVATKPMQLSPPKKKAKADAAHSSDSMKSERAGSSATTAVEIG